MTSRVRGTLKSLLELDGVGVRSSLMVFFTMLSFTTTLPFMQDHYDRVKCDDLCRGGLTSLRSACTIVGAYLVGRLSDNPFVGRRLPLLLGIFSYFIGSVTIINFPTRLGLWVGSIPSSLFGQVLSTTRAILTDYASAPTTSANVNRASLLGQIGMAAGVSFMVGPAVGAMSVSTYEEATVLGICCQVVAFALALEIPIITSPKPAQEESAQVKQETSWLDTLKSLWSLPPDTASGIQLLLCIRFVMGLAYHIYSVVWSGALKHRFNMGPKGQATYMAWLGLSYALSQGAAGKLIKLAHSHITRVVLLCLAVLAVGRTIVFNSPNIPILYIFTSFVIFSLGIMNTVISYAGSHLAESDDNQSLNQPIAFGVGTMFGLLQTTESVAGLVGPAIGGVIAQGSENLAVGVAAGLYFALFAICAVWFEQTISSKIVQHSAHEHSVTQADTSTEKSKVD